MDARNWGTGTERSPTALENLLHIIGLRLFLQSINVKSLEYAGNQIILHVTEQTPLNMARILKAVEDEKGRVKLLPDGRIVFPADRSSEDVVDCNKKYIDAVCDCVI